MEFWLHRARLGPATLVLAAALGCGGRGRELPDPGADLGAFAASLLVEAIRIPTVNPPGNERPLALLYADVLDRAGLETRVIDVPSAGSTAGRAAVWARYPGTGARRPVVLLSHLDVVPAEPKDWVVDPFAGVVAGGYVTGRGALDAKGVSVVHLLTLIELQRRGARLERDVIFLATPDEETGGQRGAGLLAAERPDLLGGAEYLLTEGGGIQDGPPGAPRIWGVTVTEKSPCWLRLTARGEPGHSSTASPDAAAHRLVFALARVLDMETELRVVPEVARMFRTLAPLSPSEDRAGLADLARALATDPGFRDRFLADPARGALVRNTVAITVLEGGPRTNVAPSEARAELDARLLPGESCLAFEERIAGVVDDPGVTIQPLLSLPSRVSPLETELAGAIRDVAAEVDPGAIVVPRVIAGFTDAHYFRERGIVSYGFVPRWLSAYESRGVHGPNERISVENLERGVRTLVRILETLAAVSPPGAPAPRGG